MLLRKEYRFESAHFIYNHPGKCKNLHGHSYRCFIVIQGKPDPITGMVMDFDHLDPIMEEHVISHLDHHFINDLISLSTAENIAIWIWQKVNPHLHGLHSVEVFETVDNCVIYSGD